MELSDPADLPLQPRPAACNVPLTAMQLRVWTDVLNRGARLSDLRICATSVRVLGPLSISLIRRCINALMQRHEALRTKFVAAGSTLTQHIDQVGECPLDIVDISATAADDIENEARRLAQEFMDEQKHLTIGPLFEAKLLRLSEREHVLVLAVDHIISDNVSCEIIGREIWILYNQAAQGLSFSLPPLPVQFADYAFWQEQTYDAWLKKHEPYWRKRLTGAPRVELPLISSLQDAQTPTRTMLAFPFDEALSAKLREMAWRERALLPAVMFALCIAALSRWCNQRDLVLTFVTHGRLGRPKLAGMVGCLAGYMYLRIEIAEEDGFVDLLKRVNLEFSSANRHQDFDRVPVLIPECADGLSFNWLSTDKIPQPFEQMHADSQVELQPFPIRPFSERVDAAFKFAVMVSDTDAGIVMNVWYRPDLFAPGVIDQFGRNLRFLAEECVRRPLDPIACVVFAS